MYATTSTTTRFRTYKRVARGNHNMVYRELNPRLPDHGPNAIVTLETSDDGVVRCDDDYGYDDDDDDDDDSNDVVPVDVY
ncbi:hypothetical protein ElyMa_004117000 [Elysia marginata]|uniref:Uncharacterized protein n=1 Tax=Elysia marginata TaxID=1093978 RepID=A0AAV4GCE4_9GAST|nr:hypothetical protein ElyMa_004117000 [Elysia marginata]